MKPKSTALAAVIAAASLLLPAAALAAPPANDDFADREALSGSLPIEVSRSNAEATKESEEFLGSFFAAGHSVWFEWEATTDGWVTVGGCEADFVDVVGVYTGAAVNALTRVAEGNSSEGPHCPYGQREYTFMAESGTMYEIVVDGNPMSFPWSPPADTEGTFKLRIEETPPPANDDFADSAILVTGLEEEYEGQAFYFGSEFGHNWNASEEAGEPNHVGGPHGASVWYSWTAPASGDATLSTCCGAHPRLSRYTGDSLGSLQLQAGGMGGSSGPAMFKAIAGTTYRIAVYGLLDGSSGEPEMGSFSLNISLQAPVLASPSGGGSVLPPPPRDSVPPDTRIRRSVKKRMPPILIFRFESTEAGSTFRCKLDNGPYRKCASQRRYEHLEPGRHTLKAFAVDAAGNADPWPAVARFKFPGPPRKAGAAADLRRDAARR